MWFTHTRANKCSSHRKKSSKEENIYIVPPTLASHLVIHQTASYIDNSFPLLKHDFITDIYT